MLVFRSSELPIPVGNVAQALWETLYSFVCVCVWEHFSDDHFAVFLCVPACIYGPLLVLSAGLIWKVHAPWYACLRRLSQFPSQCYLQWACRAVPGWTNTHFVQENWSQLCVCETQLLNSYMLSTEYLPTMPPWLNSCQVGVKEKNIFKKTE